MISGGIVSRLISAHLSFFFCNRVIVLLLDDRGAWADTGNERESGNKSEEEEEEKEEKEEEEEEEDKEEEEWKIDSFGVTGCHVRQS